MQCKSALVKVASRCNLNCSYCYMYNMGDLSYKKQPKFMSHKTVELLIDRVYEHCIEHHNKEFLFSFHGGEPLLVGIPFYEFFMELAISKLSPIVKLYFSIQTNGVLLSEEWCDLFSKYNIHLGISLDGNREENDKYRVDHSGKGSYDDTVRGINVLLNSPSNNQKPEILSVIDPETDPVARYQHFKNLGVRKIDFLMPYVTYDDPYLTSCRLSNQTPYADWLLEIFKVWFYDPSNEKPSIRLFSGIINSIFGVEFPADLLGEGNNDLLVIETDGSIEAVDALKICGDGFTKGEANVANCSFDDALNTKLANLYHYSHSKLCSRCQRCPVKQVCGGGYLPHRYSEGNGFNNPSVFCDDLLKIITHIQNAIISEFPQELREAIDVAPLTYEQALQVLNGSDEHSVEEAVIDELKNF